MNFVDKLSPEGGKVIRVNQSAMNVMGMLKGSIKVMEKKNVDGKFDDVLMKERAILQNFMDEIVPKEMVA